MLSTSLEMPVPRVRNNDSISSKKHDDWPALLALLSSSLEDQPDLTLGLTHVLVEQLGALDVEEVAAHPLRPHRRPAAP